MKKHARFARSGMGIGVAALLACAAGAAPAGAETRTIGATAVPTHDNCAAAVQTSTDDLAPSYRVPFGGTLTEWAFQGGQDAATPRLYVFRLIGPNTWKVAGASDDQTVQPFRFTRFPAHLAVRRGDRLGLGADHGCYYPGGSEFDRVDIFSSTFSRGDIGVIDNPGISSSRLNVAASIRSGQFHACAKRAKAARKQKACKLG